MTNLTEGLSPQALYTYQQALQFFLTWGVDADSAHAHAMQVALDGFGPEAVGPDVFGLPQAGGAGARASRPQRPPSPPPPHH